jgi:hypothetical protein
MSADFSSCNPYYFALSIETKMLRHVVLFKFKDSATPVQIQEVENAFKALPSKIKEIKGFEWGHLTTVRKILTRG